MTQPFQWRAWPAALTEEELSLLKRLLDPADVGYRGLPLLRPSAVHSARDGDRVVPEKRRSASCAGALAAVFDVLADVLERLQPGFVLLRGHHDLVVYEPGGFFAKHTDFSPVSAPGMVFYHCFVCLEAPCAGGATRVHAEDGAEDVALSPGTVVCIAAGTPHEGLTVEQGGKTILKFDALAFPARDLMRCCCRDETRRLPASVLRRSRFFQGLLRFEAGAPERLHRLDGLEAAELDLLFRYCLREPAVMRQAEQLFPLLEYLTAPEARLGSERFRQLLAGRPLVTTDGKEAALFCEVAAASPECFEALLGLRRLVWQEGENDRQLLSDSWLVWDPRGRGAFATGRPWFGPGASRCESPIKVCPGVQEDGCRLYASSSPSPTRGRPEAPWDDADPEEVVSRALAAVIGAQESAQAGPPPWGPGARPAAGASGAAAAPWMHAASARAAVLGAFREAAAGTGTAFHLQECREVFGREVSVFETCNDGDGFYVRSYESTGFAVFWLLLRAGAATDPGA